MKVSAFLKYVIRSLLCLFIICLILIATLPSIIATDWGKKQFLRMVNSTMEDTVSADSIALNWFGKQTVSGLTLKDAAGIGIVNAKEIVVNPSLVEILLQKPQNEFLTLNAPLEIEINIAELKRSPLGERISLLKHVESAESSIKIQIDPKDFRMPISHWNLEELSIGKATIHLGKMQLSSEGQLGTMVALLHPSHTGPIPIWFTPLYLHVKQGKVYIERVDLLVLNSYPLAVWGTVDIPKDQVDMHIGITGTALRRSTGIVNLGANDMIQIPFTGSLNKPSIDKGKAAAKIGSLVVEKHGSDQAALIGTVLGIAGGNLTEEKPPLPTTNPLPWASLLETAAPSTKNHSNRKEESIEESKKEEFKYPQEKKKDKQKSKKENKKQIDKKIKEMASSILEELL